MTHVQQKKTCFETLKTVNNLIHRHCEGNSSYSTWRICYHPRKPDPVACIPSTRLRRVIYSAQTKLESELPQDRKPTKNGFIARAIIIFKLRKSLGTVSAASACSSTIIIQFACFPPFIPYLVKTSDYTHAAGWLAGRRDPRASVN